MGRRNDENAIESAGNAICLSQWVVGAVWVGGGGRWVGGGSEGVGVQHGRGLEGGREDGETR